jgi:hypothetical protein
MTFTPCSLQIYHHHWLALWKPLAFIALLVVLGAGGVLVWLPLGLVLFTLALIVAMSIYLYWSWHTFAFTADNRLIRRRGFLGCTEDVISLFGVITPHYTPVLGRWLDVGDVYLSLPGPDSHIRHIANFEAFHHRLVYGAQQRGSPSTPSPVQIIVQLPPVQRVSGDRRDLLFPGEPEPTLTYPGATIREGEQPDRTH